MRTLRSIQTSFTSGELDPRLSARIEVSRYYAGAARLRNVVPLPQGGVTRRPGFRHIATLPAEAGDGLRLIPFAFSAAQSFLIAVYHQGFQVFRGNDGTLLFTATGQPWTATIAQQVNWTQSADTLILLHHDLPPWRIQRAGSDTSWTSAALTLSNIPTWDYGSGPEPVISASRGWPECGCFHQGRFWLGGLKSRPTTLLASKVAQYFDLALGSADDDGMMLTLDTDQLNAVHQLLPHRGLLIFTSGAEHAITVAPPITPTNVAIEEQSRRGIKRYARVDEVDGAVLFVQRGGAALRQFEYSELEQAWRADLASLLAPHLILDPRDVVIRKAAVQDDADLVLLPDAAGITVLSTLRSQEVTAFARWTVDGDVRGVAALPNGTVWLASGRDGAVRLLFLDPLCLLDHSLRFSFAAPVGSLTGLAHLAGRQAVMLLDGRAEGTITVPPSGAITLPRDCLTAEIGLGVPVEIATMPIEPRAAEGPAIGRRLRLVEATIRVFQSGSYDLRGTTLNTRTLGDDPAPPLDVVPPPPPVWRSGDDRLQGLVGWAARQAVTISQPPDRPAPLTVQAVALTVALGG